jgi:hypothetical protein
MRQKNWHKCYKRKFECRFHNNVVDTKTSTKLIHVWNKISKHILMQNGLKIYYPLHLDYNFQYFEQIEYVNGV